MKLKRIEFEVMLIIATILSVELWAYFIIASIPCTGTYPGISILYWLENEFRFQISLMILALIISPQLTLLLNRVGYRLDSKIKARRASLIVIGSLVTVLCLFCEAYLFWKTILYITHVFQKPRAWLLPLVILIGSFMTLISLTIISWGSTGKAPWRSELYRSFKGIIFAFTISIVLFSAVMFSIAKFCYHEYYLADRQDMQELYTINPILADEVKRAQLIYAALVFSFPSSVLAILLVLVFHSMYLSFSYFKELLCSIIRD